MTKLHPDLERILVSENDIQKCVDEIAAKIANDFKDVDRLYIVGVLKGAFIFLADLTRALSELNVAHVVDFMAVSSYGKSTESGAVRILMDLREPADRQHILLVEDIVDTGHTLSYLYNVIKGRNPASLHTCAFVQKERDSLDVPISYLGYKIPDVWVVGYGLDYADRHRTLPFVAELKPETYQ